MTTIIGYNLAFRSPLHLGARGVGLEESRTCASADTLFSALCLMWRELYGLDGERGLDALLNAFRVEGAKPFLLSSAFPYAGTVRFFPRPLVHGLKGDDKAWRRVQFVSAARFEQLLAGERPSLERAHCLNSGTVWVSAEELPALAAWLEGQSGTYQFWRQAVVPRVTLDRITAASTIWQLGSVQFAEGCGLWFAAQIADDWRAQFEPALRLLGDTGLGGERGAGYGLFTLAQRVELNLPAARARNHFVTLAPCAPATADELAALTADTEASYHLMIRRGWVTSTDAANLRRPDVWMFGEGSFLCGPDSVSTGCLVNATPAASPHKVWRYGLAFPVGANLCANI